MDKREFYSLLEEASAVLNSKYNVALTEDYIEVVGDPDKFTTYKEILKEGLAAEDQHLFDVLAENVRDAMIQEMQTTASWTPYQQLVLPLIRFVFPRLVAKEAVTVSPISAPEVVKYFIQAVVNSFDGTTTELPSISNTVSQGPSSPVTVAVDLSANSVATVNFKSAAGVPEPDKVIITRTVFVNKAATVDPSTGDTIEIDIAQKIDPITGQATIPVMYTTSAGTVSDTILIAVNFETGDVTVTSTTGETKSVTVTGNISLETNNYIPRVELKLQKIPLSAMTRSLSAKWSIEAMQDFKALLDLDYQSEIVAIIGQQIANDIDVEIINDILQFIQFTNPTSVASFTKTPPSTYAFGQKRWIEDQLVPTLTQLSGKIYADTNIGEANFIMAHPQDAALLQALDTFKLDGNSTGGDLMYGYGCRIGTVAGRYKVLVSPNVPQGKLVLGLKPEEERLACYLYAPYIPVTITPYPLSDNPTVTFKTRYAKAMIRPKAYALIEVV